MTRLRWVGVMVGLVLALGACDSGDTGPGTPEGPGAPGGPVGTDPGDGGAQGAPVTIPDFLNLSGGTPEQVEELIRERIRDEACGGTDCLDVVVVNKTSGTRNCNIGQPDPPTGSTTESGSTVTVPITCEEENGDEFSDESDEPPTDESPSEEP
jgi:hypothetical protein